jgi:hypothetical protein
MRPFGNGNGNGNQGDIRIEELGLFGYQIDTFSSDYYDDNYM